MRTLLQGLYGWQFCFCCRYRSQDAVSVVTGTVRSDRSALPCALQFDHPSQLRGHKVILPAHPRPHACAGLVAIWADLRDSACACAYAAGAVRGDVHACGPNSSSKRLTNIKRNLQCPDSEPDQRQCTLHCNHNSSTGSSSKMVSC